MLLTRIPRGTVVPIMSDSFENGPPPTPQKVQAHEVYRYSSFPEAAGVVFAPPWRWRQPWVSQADAADAAGAAFARTCAALCGTSEGAIEQASPIGNGHWTFNCQCQDPPVGVSIYSPLAVKGCPSTTP